jgi:hypothetical protein
VSVSGDHTIIVVDLTAPADCDWAVMDALIMVLRYTNAGGGVARRFAKPGGPPGPEDVGMDGLFTVFDTLAVALPVRDTPWSVASRISPRPNRPGDHLAQIP